MPTGTATSPSSSGSTSTSPDPSATGPGAAEPPRVLDADSHLLEHPRFLADHAPTALADELLLPDQDDPRPGAVDPVGRRAVLDELGVDAQLVLSTAAAPFVASLPADRQVEASRAHQRAVLDWCDRTGDPRCLPVAFVPRHDPATAAALIEEAATAGCAAVHLASDPRAGPGPDDPRNDALWSALASTGRPLVLHVATGGTLVPGPWRGPASGAAPAAGGDGIRALELALAHNAPERFLGALVLGGVLDRHPGLRALVLEQGASWVPPWLARLDAVHEVFGRAGHLPPLATAPSLAVRRAMGFAPHPFERVADLVGAAGPDLWLWASDWPHVEGGRDPRNRPAWVVDDEAARRAFLGANLVRLLPASALALAGAG